MFLEIPRRYEDGSRDAVPQLLVFEKVSDQHFLVKLYCAKEGIYLVEGYNV